MWTQFVDLFAGYGIIPMIILCFGALFCIIEIFVPGFGVFGIVGGISSVGAIIARMVMGANMMQFLIMMLFVITIVVGALIIMIISTKFGLIKRSPLVENKTSVPVNYVKDNKTLLKMLGEITFATTDFKPVGKFTYNSETFEALTYGEYLKKGEKIQIVEIKGDRIYVKKV